MKYLFYILFFLLPCISFSQGILVNPTPSNAIADLQLDVDGLKSAQNGGLIGYSTLATMNADTGQPTGTVAIVYNEVINNNVYVWDGATWALSLPLVWVTDDRTNQSTTKAASARIVNEMNYDDPVLITSDTNAIHGYHNSDNWQAGVRTGSSSFTIEPNVGEFDLRYGRFFGEWRAIGGSITNEQYLTEIRGDYQDIRNKYRITIPYFLKGSGSGAQIFAQQYLTNGTTTTGFPTHPSPSLVKDEVDEVIFEGTLSDLAGDVTDRLSVLVSLNDGDTLFIPTIKIEIIPAVDLRKYVTPVTVPDFRLENFPDTTKIIQTYTVCASGCDYTTPKAAFDAVPSGDILNGWNRILVKAGTYTDQLQMNFNKNFIIIEGEGTDKTVIQGDGTSPTYNSIPIDQRHMFEMQGGAFWLKKVRLDVLQCKYNIHNDASGAGQYVFIAENVLFTHDNQNVGIGFANYQNSYFYNCTFINRLSGDAFNCHTNTPSTIPSNVVIENCEFYGGMGTFSDFHNGQLDLIRIANNTVNGSLKINATSAGGGYDVNWEVHNNTGINELDITNRHDTVVVASDFMKYYRNLSGGTLAKGTAVKINDAGTGVIPAIDNDFDGIVWSDFTDNNWGYIVTSRKGNIVPALTSATLAVGNYVQINASGQVELSANFAASIGKAVEAGTGLVKIRINKN